MEYIKTMVTKLIDNLKHQGGHKWMFQRKKRAMGCLIKVTTSTFSLLQTSNLSTTLSPNKNRNTRLKLNTLSLLSNHKSPN